MSKVLYFPQIILGMVLVWFVPSWCITRIAATFTHWGCDPRAVAGTSKFWIPHSRHWPQTASGRLGTLPATSKIYLLNSAERQVRSSKFGSRRPTTGVDQPRIDGI